MIRVFCCILSESCISAGRLGPSVLVITAGAGWLGPSVLVNTAGAGRVGPSVLVNTAAAGNLLNESAARAVFAACTICPYVLESKPACQVAAGMCLAGETARG